MHPDQNIRDSTYRYYTSKGVTKNYADHTAQMHRLICILVVHIWHEGS